MNEIVKMETVYRILEAFRAVGMDLSILDFQVFDEETQTFMFPTGTVDIQVSDDGTTGSFTVHV